MSFNLHRQTAIIRMAIEAIRHRQAMVKAANPGRVRDTVSIPAAFAIDQLEAAEKDFIERLRLFNVEDNHRDDAERVGLTQLIPGDLL